MNPFDLNDQPAYAAWREQKLSDYPTELSELIVAVDDPHKSVRIRISGYQQTPGKTNMAIYASELGEDPHKDIIRKLGAQFGLNHLDNNMCADEDAISSLEDADSGTRTGYIPYTNRPITWHTDGYYNKPEQQIRGLVLHCVRPADTGGMNQLLDHEIAYIQLRDKNPDYIAALMHPQAMMIPANVVNGEELRPDRTGPVFSIMDNGQLHMRYTHRKRNISWRDDAMTREAIAYLDELMTPDSPYYFEGTLQAGQGLICNNVLHTRTGFEEHSKRLLYRARYFDPVKLDDSST